MPNANETLRVAQQLQRGLTPDIIPQAWPFHISTLCLQAERVAETSMTLSLASRILSISFWGM